MDRYKLDVYSCGRKYDRVLKAICSGYFTHAAKKDPTEGYRSLVEGNLVYIHPSSSLFQKKPDWYTWLSVIRFKRHLIFLYVGFCTTKLCKPQRSTCGVSSELTRNGSWKSRPISTERRTPRSSPSKRGEKRSNLCGTSMPSIRMIGEFRSSVCTLLKRPSFLF